MRAALFVLQVGNDMRHESRLPGYTMRNGKTHEVGVATRRTPRLSPENC